MYEQILKLAKTYVIFASRKLQPYPISEEERVELYRIAEYSVNALFAIAPENRREGLEFFRTNIKVGNIEIPIIFVFGSGFSAFYDLEDKFIQLIVDRKETDRDNLLFQATLTLIHEYTHIFQGEVSFNNFLYSMLKQFIEFSQTEKDFDRVYAFNDLEEFVAEQYPDHLRQFRQYKRTITELPLTELDNLKNRMYDTSPDEREARENELLERIRYNKLWDFAYEYIRSGYQKQRIKQLVESYAIAGELDITKQQINRVSDQVLMDIEDNDIIGKLLKQHSKNEQQQAERSFKDVAAE